MKNYVLKCTTRSEDVVLLFLSAMISAGLVLIGHKPIAQVSPIVLLVICVITLLLDWKTIYIGFDKLCIRYHLALVKKSICIDRVTSVEVVVEKQKYTLLFLLDGCPTLESTKRTNWRFYQFKHLVKGIFLQCSKETAFQCIAYFRNCGIHTGVIHKGSQNYDLRRRN